MIEDDKSRLVELLPKGERVLARMVSDKEAEDGAMCDDNQVALGVALEHVVNPTLEPL